MSSCKRAAFLSSRLLTFAKGGAPVRRVVSVADLVTDAVRLARTGTPITISVSVAEDLGFAAVDPGQIAQTLHNILHNAPHHASRFAPRQFPTAKYRRENLA